MTEKFCKDCYHCRITPSGRWLDEMYLCTYYREEVHDLITGEVVYTGTRPCSAIRYNEENCGREGKFWAPR